MISQLSKNKWWNLDWSEVVCLLMITNCITWFDAFLWPKFSGNLINYLETAKATDHMKRTLFHKAILAGQSQRRTAHTFAPEKHLLSVPFTPWNWRMEGSFSIRNELPLDLAITVFTPPSVLYDLCPPAFKYPSRVWEQQTTKLKRVHLHMKHFNQHADIVPPHTTAPQEMQKKMPQKKKKRWLLGGCQEEEVSGGKEERDSVTLDESSNTLQHFIQRHIYCTILPPSPSPRLLKHHDTHPHTHTHCQCLLVKEMSWCADINTNWMKTAFHLISHLCELACYWIERPTRLWLTQKQRGGVKR